MNIQYSIVSSMVLGDRFDEATYEIHPLNDGGFCVVAGPTRGSNDMRDRLRNEAGNVRSFRTRRMAQEFVEQFYGKCDWALRMKQERE